MVVVLLGAGLVAVLEVVSGFGVAWFWMLVRLKYHEGAVNLICEVFGVESMRTSNSR